ncbi:MAG TPA: hypothetical protein VFW30_02880 [Bryocella sp.]|nr:hypothetical protein [Bryocella sp.]
MRLGIVVAGLMIAASVAQAQQTKAAEPQIPTEQQKKTMVALQPPIEQQKKTIVVLQGATSGSECPGALRASQQATGGGTVWTTALEDRKDSLAKTMPPHGLGVHVQFADLTAVRMLELRVTYEPLGLKRMPVELGTNGFASAMTEREKNFNVDREAATLVDADLLVGPAATITRVYLLSARFADGSVWRASTPDACSVVPNRFMLVKSK